MVCMIYLVKSKDLPLLMISQENENYNSNFTNYVQALLDNRLSEIKQYITNLKLK